MHPEQALDRVVHEGFVRVLTGERLDPALWVSIALPDGCLREAGKIVGRSDPHLEDNSERQVEDVATAGLDEGRGRVSRRADLLHDSVLEDGHLACRAEVC